MYGETKSTTGGAGVYGKSDTSCGVIAINSNPESSAPALYAKKEHAAFKNGNPDDPNPGDAHYAAIFEGSVKITGLLIFNNKTVENLLRELELRLDKQLLSLKNELKELQDNKILRLIYELEDQLNITLPKS